MRTIKFKTKKLKYKNLILLTLTLNLILCISFTLFISKHLSKKIIVVSEKIVKRESELSLKKAFSNDKNKNIDTTDLINVIQNSKEEIVEVEFKLNKCEEVMRNIISYMDENINKHNNNGYILYVPLGYITNSPLLINLGPKIPLKVSATNYVMGSVKTEVESFGINNALIEVYIEISLSLDTNLPLNNKQTNIKYEQLVASKIIAGTIPSFYSGELYTKSERITLPLTE